MKLGFLTACLPQRSLADLAAWAAANAFEALEVAAWPALGDRPFTATPFGTYSPRAVVITTVAFMLAHAPSDWLGALVFGLAMAWLAVRSKSLAACVAMHAVANLALGVYVMATRSWGFW